MGRWNRSIMGLSVSLLAVGCSPQKFSMEKNDFLAGSSALSSTGTPKTEDEGGDENDTPVIRGVEIRRVCSNDRTAASGSVITAAKVRLVVTNQKGMQVCADNMKDYRSDLINKSEFSIGAECVLADGKYSAKLVDEAFLLSGKSLASFSIVMAAGVAHYEADRIDVTYFTNPTQKKDNKVVVREAAHADCDAYASPLVVKLKNEAIKLSAPLDGIDFDILGASNEHSLNRISWPENDAMAFLALPDRHGEVSGIDQLFGDNTMGPDHQTASDGYAALAKYDLNHDGKIDKNDAVFSKLRLWIDRNRDGRSQARELQSLAAQNIKSIDLDFAADYKEKDQYGNQILFKSIATKTDGSLLLVFDIWFRLIN